MKRYCPVRAYYSRDCRTYTLFGGECGVLEGIAEFNEGNSLQDRAAIGQGARANTFQMLAEGSPIQWMRLTFWRG